jgi:hypothetical protein
MNKPSINSPMKSKEIADDQKCQVVTVLAPSTEPMVQLKEMVPALTNTSTRDQIIERCHEKLSELQLFEDRVSVPCRVSTLLSHTHPSIKVSAMIHNEKKLTNPYDVKYRTMKAHHHASHALMRKRMIDATRSTIYSIMDAPIPSSIEKAKGFLHSAIFSFQDLTVRFFSSTTAP